MRLTNKLAIVTGAGSGFGAGIARRFAEEGARVVVNDIDAKSGERVAKEIGGSFVQADVTKGARLGEAGARRRAGARHRGQQRRLDAPQQALPRGLRGRVRQGLRRQREKRLPFGAARGPGIPQAAAAAASSTSPRPPASGRVPASRSTTAPRRAVILMSKSMAAEFGPDRIRVNCVNPVFSPETSLSAEFAGGA